MRSTRRQEDFSLIISDVIQEDNVLREDLLDLVMSDEWRSSSERREVRDRRSTDERAKRSGIKIEKKLGQNGAL